MPKITKPPKFKVSIVSHEEVESGKYFSKKEVAKRNLYDYLKAVVESFIAQTKIDIDKIEIKPNNGKIEIIIKEKLNDQKETVQKKSKKE